MRTPIEFLIKCMFQILKSIQKLLYNTIQYNTIHELKGYDAKRLTQFPTKGQKLCGAHTTLRNKHILNLL